MDAKLALITGAPGWLGTRLVRTLLEGLPDDLRFAAPDPTRRIRCLVLRGMPTQVLTSISPNIELFEGDLREPHSLKDFFLGAEGSVVFHLSGIIHPRKIHDLYAINSDGTRNILDAAAAAGAQRIIVISSNSPIGCNPAKDHLFDESSPYNPYLNYGRSKMEMEELVLEASHAGRIETVILRPCWFYGPDQPLRQTRFFTMIREGKAPIVAGGESRRSMSYIDNTCQALRLAEITAAARGKIYWIADKHPYSMKEIVDCVEHLLEAEFHLSVRHRRLRLPGFVSEIAYVADRCIQSIGSYNQEIHVLSEMNKTIACSIRRAQAELGYDPKIDLEEGMRRSIRWCLDNNISL